MGRFLSLLLLLVCPVVPNYAIEKDYVDRGQQISDNASVTVGSSVIGTPTAPIENQRTKSTEIGSPQSTTNSSFPATISAVSNSNLAGTVQMTSRNDKSALRTRRHPITRFPATRPPNQPAGPPQNVPNQPPFNQQPQLRIAQTRARVITDPEAERKLALKKSAQYGQVMQMGTDYLARYGLQQQYQIRFAPPPLNDPWPMPQTFDETFELHTIDPEDLQWKVYGPNDCPTLKTIISRYKSQKQLYTAARPLATEDAILEPGPRYVTTTMSSSSSQSYGNTTGEHESPGWHWDSELGIRARTWLKTGKIVERLIIKVNTCDKWPRKGSIENYTLVINSNEILISAPQVWGALYGLETLSQLMVITDIPRSAKKLPKMLVRGASIRDFPRFRHRGLMLDSSRHFLPKSIIKLNMDAMVQNKLNVFHWHLSDDQSFPLHLNSFPEFARLASFSPDQFYSHDDVREIVEYARVRGIRVMPEIDTPSHVLAWRHLPADILTRCYGFDGTPDGDLGPLDPTKNATYEVIMKILTEVSSLFPDQSFHAGGDEVPNRCWQNNPSILNFTKNHGPNGPNGPPLQVTDLQVLFNKKLIEIIRQSRREFLESTMDYGPDGGSRGEIFMWEEAATNDFMLDRNVTVHVWKSDQNFVRMMAARGHSVIFSQCWYLNYINYGVDWHKYYTCDPAPAYRANVPMQQQQQQTVTPNEQTKAENDRIIGGEICMWGEYIDETNIIPILWPRASAAAERLWSHASLLDTMGAGRRLEEHRCRMLQRGIAAAPISGPGGCGQTLYVSSKALRSESLYVPPNGVRRVPDALPSSLLADAELSEKCHQQQAALANSDRVGGDKKSIPLDFDEAPSESTSQVKRILVPIEWVIVSIVLTALFGNWVVRKACKILQKVFRPILSKAVIREHKQI